MTATGSGAGDADGGLSVMETGDASAKTCGVKTADCRSIGVAIGGAVTTSSSAGTSAAKPGAIA